MGMVDTSGKFDRLGLLRLHTKSDAVGLNALSDYKLLHLYTWNTQMAYNRQGGIT